jgi:hypothetical protein
MLRLSVTYVRKELSVGNFAIQVNGSTAGDGFLIAPDSNRNFPVPLVLPTTDGSTQFDNYTDKPGIDELRGSVRLPPEHVIDWTAFCPPYRSGQGAARNPVTEDRRKSDPAGI